ncbi:MAG TPA: PH domain-containing protein [Anaeromyxobacter sp.]|nr:PH domain-containing protein [Anaeromyxobacter sp.]
MRDALITFAVLAVLMFGGRFLVARRLSSAGPVHVRSTDGGFILRPPRRDAVLGGIALVLPAIMLGALTVRAWSGGGASLAAPLVAALLAAFGAIYLFASAIRSRVIVRETGIERVGVFRRRLAGWTSVSKITFNPAHRWFFVTMSDRSHLWLRADVAGIGDFARVTLRRVAPAALAADPMARDVLEDLAAAARKAAREE